MIQNPIHLKQMTSLCVVLCLTQACGANDGDLSADGSAESTRRDAGAEPEVSAWYADDTAPDLATAADGGLADGDSSDAGGVLQPHCAHAWADDLQMGTAADDQILGIAVDGEDNIIASGFEGGSVGVTNIEPDGNAEAFVVKYDSNGGLVWKTLMHTAGTDTAEDVAVDRQTGNLIVLGRTSGAFAPFTNQGQFDLFLAVLSPVGQLNSVFQTGNERPAHPVRLALSPGKVTVAGYDDTYVQTNHIAANPDGFVAGFTMGGGPLPTFRQTSLQYLFPPSPSAPYNIVLGVAVEPDDSGASYVISGVPSNHGGRHGIFVEKRQGTAPFVWNQTLSTSLSDQVTAVALSPTGDLFVTGATFLPLGAASFGQQDVFLTKINKVTGAPLWTLQAGGPSYDYPTSLAFDGQGNVYVAGSTMGTVVDGVANRGGADIFAMKISAAGKLVSVWQRGTPAHDQVTSMAVDHCGHVFVGGYTAGDLVPSHPGVGGQDAFILRANF